MVDCSSQDPGDFSGRIRVSAPSMTPSRRIRRFHEGRGPSPGSGAAAAQRWAAPCPAAMEADRDGVPAAQAAASAPLQQHKASLEVSPGSKMAVDLLSSLHGAQGLSAPAQTVPVGLLPAGTAARPPALSSAPAPRTVGPPAAKRVLPTVPPGLEPAGSSARPPPPPPPQQQQPQPQPSDPPLQRALVPSATGSAGRSLKRKIISTTDGGLQAAGPSAETGVTAATHPVAVSRPHARHTPRDKADLLPPPPRGTEWRWEPTHINADGADAGPNGIKQVLQEAASAAAGASAQPALKILRGHCHVHVKRDVQQNKHRVFNGDSNEQKATASKVPSCPHGVGSHAPHTRPSAQP